jgi:hypothetical protein
MCTVVGEPIFYHITERGDFMLNSFAWKVVCIAVAVIVAVIAVLALITAYPIMSSLILGFIAGVYGTHRIQGLQSWNWLRPRP